VIFRRTLLGILSWATLAALPLAAQDSLIVIDPDAPLTDTLRSGPPLEILDAVLRGYNDSLTTRLTGNFSLPAGSTLTGQLGLYRGVLRIAGTVNGPVMVVNGDLIVESRGVITGEVLVVGGRLTVLAGGRIGGRRQVFIELAPVLRSPTGILIPRPPRPSFADIATARTTFRAGRINTTLSIETGRTYNRIEGLPIAVGPTFTLPTVGGTEGRLEARVIFRTSGRGSTIRDEFGLRLGSEWAFSGLIRGGLGAEWSSTIVPIEEQPLSRGESGWSAFLLSRDYRDYYESRGVEFYGWLFPIRDLRLEAAWRRDRQRSVQVTDPVRIFRNDEPWRPNPLIDDGHYRSLRFRADLDTRNSRVSGTTGWLVQAEVEHAESDDTSPVGLPTEVRSPLPAFREFQFTRLAFDVKRYTRFSPGTTVNLRVVGGGWIDGDPLPLQRRVSLGGPDLLPGSGFRAITCAPATFVDAARPALCDRYLATQVEIRSRLHLGRILPPRDYYGFDQLLDLANAELVLFGDAGHAWLTGRGPGRVPNNRLPNFSEWRKDVGVGIDTGTLGLYLAKGTQGEPLRFTVRLERRF